MTAATPSRREPAGGTISTGRRFAIRLLCVCVLGPLAGAGWLVLRPAPDRELTSYGLPVANARSVIGQAEAATRRTVAQRHGRLASDARCYFAAASSAGVARPEASDRSQAIGNRMYCGPAAFVDGDLSRPYLRYDLVGTPTGDGRIRLAVGPVGGDTTDAEPRPAGLLRPDGKQPAPHPRLSAPAPPAAVGDVLTTTGTLRSGLTPAPDSAVMIGQVSGVRLVEYGFVDSYGWGDRARTAPPGYRLIAFAVAPVPGEVAADTPDLSVRVDGHERGPLATTSDYIVMAVPAEAREVDLVLTDSGLEQSVSLLTGRPDPANPAVTVRVHQRQRLDVSRSVRVQLSTPGGSGTLAGTLTVRQVSLSYWAANGQRATGADRAWLHVSAVVRLSGDPQAYGAESALLTVSVPGTGRLTTMNAAGDPQRQVDDVADVPASLTRGSLTYSGSVRTAKGTLTVLTPTTVPFAIPAG